MSPADLITKWQTEATELRASANTHRANGMFELARGERLKADHLTDCAAQLTAITPATTVSSGPAAGPPPASSPTSLPLPTPRALRIASTLSKLTLRMLLGFPPVPAHVLASRCNTILHRRGETEPLDAQDLQAAARLQWQQKGYRPCQQPLSQALEGCQESPAGTHAAPARSSLPAPRPTKESVPGISSPDSAEAAPAPQPPTAN